MAFAGGLVISVKNAANDPVQGVSLTFNAPASGSSGLFGNSSTSIAAVTDVNGQASETFTADGTLGSYTVTALAAGLATSASFTLTNNVIATSTTLTDNGLNPTLISQSVGFTITESAGSVGNGETVALEDASNGNATVGSATLNGGSASITVSNLIAQPPTTPFAVYGGDATHAGQSIRSGHAKCCRSPQLY